MKKTALLLIVLIGTFSNSLLAQDTIYFNKDNHKVKTAAEAYIYSITKQLPNHKAIRKQYFISGEKKAIINYKIANSKMIPHGNKEEWNKKGQLIENSDYKDGKQHGLQVYYWDNGNIRRKDIFKRGKLKSGECWDKDGNPIKYFPRRIMPKFRDGNNSTVQWFIQKHLKYPKISAQYGITGKVFVGFVVNKKGELCKVRVLKGVNKELDQEAIRVVNKMKDWQPGYLEGEPVDISFTVPINFSIPKEKKNYDF